MSAFPYEAILDPTILNKFVFLGKVVEKVVARLFQGTLDDLNSFSQDSDPVIRLIWH